MVQSGGRFNLADRAGLRVLRRDTGFRAARFTADSVFKPSGYLYPSAEVTWPSPLLVQSLGKEGWNQVGTHTVDMASHAEHTRMRTLLRRDFSGAHIVGFRCANRNQQTGYSRYMDLNLDVRPTDRSQV